ncbi:MAG TPA: DUF3995 domain-containing protein [Nocardioidaceae bacterium]|nr:DUF3995 domain-containing protein [Nocardioidaceae bacterium]
MVWAVAFVALHGYWALGGRVGFGDQTDPIPVTTDSVAGWAFTVVVATMFGCGLAVPLALLRPWGLRVPRRLLLVLMWIGAVVLIARGGMGLLDGTLRTLGLDTGLTGLSYERTLGDASPSAYTLWSSAAIDAIFFAGGVLFTRSARLTGQRRVIAGWQRRGTTSEPNYLSWHHFDAIVMPWS